MWLSEALLGIPNVFEIVLSLLDLETGLHIFHVLQILDVEVNW